MDNVPKAASGDFSRSHGRTALSVLLQVVNEERVREFPNGGGQLAAEAGLNGQESETLSLDCRHGLSKTTTNDWLPQHPNPGNGVTSMPSVPVWSSPSNEISPVANLRAQVSKGSANNNTAENQQNLEPVDEHKLLRHSSASRLAHSIHGYLEYLCEKFPRDAHSFSALSLTDFAANTLKLKEQQDVFRATSKPTQVDVGYHITQSSNMVLIRRFGLRSFPERQAMGITAGFFNGASLGHGIYTANDLSHLHYGETCLLVARLRGLESSDNVDFAHDTFVRGDEVVLRSSSQCMLLLEFSTSTSHVVLRQACTYLQKLVKEIFNAPSRTQLPRTLFSQPDRLIIESTAFQTKCVVCFSWMQTWENVVSLKVCGHVGHYECFVAEIRRQSSCCPRCNKCIVVKPILPVATIMTGPDAASSARSLPSTSDIIASQAAVNRLLEGKGYELAPFLHLKHFFLERRF